MVDPIVWFNSKPKRKCFDDRIWQMATITCLFKHTFLVRGSLWLKKLTNFIENGFVCEFVYEGVSV